MATLLDGIIKENDIKNIPPEDYKKLAYEIRKKLIKSVSHTGGHLASNLGAVELTIALHLCLDFPKDKLVWDVGHQAYTHKLLTGRQDVFCSLRSYGGISGFPKVSENPSDTFDTGHSSTSISVAMGLAKARDIQGSDEKIFAVIGDGALTGGMAFEALNNLSQIKSNMVVVLNDNKMSIAQNVGGMSNYLGKIRVNRQYNHLKEEVLECLDKIPNLGNPIADRIKRLKDSIKHLLVPGMLFEDMGLTYIGPIDGHHIDEMLTAFTTASEADKPVLVHVITKKGKGYRPAEEKPAAYHGVDPFDYHTGTSEKEKEGIGYTDIFGDWMVKTGKTKEELAAVTAAMPTGTGLKSFSEHFPDRFFDVGIAEEHAVTFAAGLAAGGLKPVVALYSTFLQRAYDQILHDVCLGNKPVTFAIDRSGLVGKDGETHQGIYDISFLCSIPNLTVLAPMDGEELKMSLDFAMDYNGPIVIKYPRGAAFFREEGEVPAPIEYGKAEIIKKEKDILLLAVGDMVETALEVYDGLKDMGRKATVVNMRFVKPFDKELVLSLCKKHKTIVTLEDGVQTGGFGQQVKALLFENKCQKECISICLPDRFIEHGSPEELKEKYGLNAASVLEKIERGGAG